MVSAHHCMHLIDQSLQSIHQVLALPRNWSAHGVCKLQVVTSSVNGLEKVSHLTAEYCLGHHRSLVSTRIHHEHIDAYCFTISPNDE